MSLRPSARTEVRRNRYKVSVDAEEGRRRREDNMVEIRKNRREESLQKKRREGLQAQTLPASIHSAAVEKKLEFLPSMVAGVWTDDSNIQLEATTQFRKLLSIERCPQLRKLFNLALFLALLSSCEEDFPQLQFEAAWALTNIASGTSDNTKVAVWALGNVAGDSPRCVILSLPWGSASFAGTVERTCKAVYAQECYLDTFKFL
ncbi:Importin subunit alpha-2 [Vitis vinifera]|uniref:Importin subunit alpha-2 n=1 Tax=Vitis vinifera TaxID=29760 RepID=A0A438DUU3_VITVI|nr:Importin subunit alpha-2 [Vitis vinifera]